MNYSLKDLKDRVTTLIDQLGEDADCAAWIYTKYDCHLKDENGDTDWDSYVEDKETLECIFSEVGNIDYIYQVIQDCVDEVVNEQLILKEQGMIKCL